MYTIIGADGNEYGPVSAEQVRAWMASGRANLDTRAKEAGSDTWKTVAAFPELAGAAGAVSPGAGIPPVAASPALDITGCYERSWALLKANFWPFVGATLLLLAVYVVLAVCRYPGSFLVSGVIEAPLSAGVYYFFLLRARGQPSQFGDVFAGYSRAFLAIVLTWLGVFLLVAVGLCLLILPGIYLGVAYGFAILLAVDQKLSPWVCMETSRRTVTRQWWRVLGVILLAIPFLLLGAAALGIGILVACPLVMGAMVYAYEDLFGSAATVSAP